MVSELFLNVSAEYNNLFCSLAFFLTWRFDPTYAMSNETTRGGTSFKLVTDDKSINKKGLSGDDDIENLRINSKCILMQNESFIKDWEIVNLTELENKLKAEEENDNLSLPKLIGETKILNDEHLKLVKEFFKFFKIK